MSTETKLRAVIGSYNVKIGDTVRVDLSLLDSESRHYYKGPPDGTELTICGFRQCDRYYGPTERLYLDGREPGLYRSYGKPIGQYEVEVEGRYGNSRETKYVQLDTHAIRLINREQTPDVRASQEHLFNKGWRIDDLPQVPFYPGDMIRAKPDSRTVSGNSVEEFVGKDPVRVENVEWHWDNMPVRIELNGGGTTSTDPENFDLVERGNYYWWEHDRTKLKFKDIREETAFYYSLGMMHQLRSPKTGNYRWGQKEAFRACLEGVGDVVKDSGSFFGSSNFPTLYKFDDSLKDLADRCRAEYEKEREWAYSEPLDTDYDRERADEERKLYEDLGAPADTATS